MFFLSLFKFLWSLHDLLVVLRLRSLYFFLAAAAFSSCTSLCSVFALCSAFAIFAVLLSIILPQYRLLFFAFCFSLFIYVFLPSFPFFGCVFCLACFASQLITLFTVSACLSCIIIAYIWIRLLFWCCSFSCYSFNFLSFSSFLSQCSLFILLASASSSPSSLSSKLFYSSTAPNLFWFVYLHLRLFLFTSSLSFPLFIWTRWRKASQNSALPVFQFWLSVHLACIAFFLFFFSFFLL